MVSLLLILRQDREQVSFLFFMLQLYIALCFLEGIAYVLAGEGIRVEAARECTCNCVEHFTILSNTDYMLCTRIYEDLADVLRLAGCKDDHIQVSERFFNE